MFQFQYTLNEHDYFEFNKYHTFNSPITKTKLRKQHLIIPACFVGMGVGIGLIAGERFLAYYFYITFGLIAILWLIFYKQFIIRRIRKNIENIKKNSKSPFQREVTISFEDDFIFVSTKDGETKARYTAIERAVTVEEGIYIYTSANQAIILPLNVFSDNENRDGFLRYIEERRSIVQ